MALRVLADSDSSPFSFTRFDRNVQNTVPAGVGGRQRRTSNIGPARIIEIGVNMRHGTINHALWAWLIPVGVWTCRSRGARIDLMAGEQFDELVDFFG